MNPDYEAYRMGRRELSAKLRALGYSPQLAHKYINGDCLPSLEVAVRIAREVGIPCEAWVDRRQVEAMQELMA